VGKGARPINKETAQSPQAWTVLSTRSKPTSPYWSVFYHDCLEKSNASHPEDGAWGNSEVGRKCKALMESVIYGKRALPIAWIVVQGNKGHYPEEIHSRVWCLLSEAAPKQAAICRLL
jgi:hypothetical protein